MKLFCAFLLISGSCQQSLVILPRFVQHKAYLHLYFHMAFLPVFALLPQVYWWLDWDSTLIQHDLILINIQRYYFQIRSQSLVIGIRTSTYLMKGHNWTFYNLLSAKQKANYLTDISSFLTTIVIKQYCVSIGLSVVYDSLWSHRL